MKDDVSLRFRAAVLERKLSDWELQTSGTLRISTKWGDGDVLCGTAHTADLLAAPGVLDYIVTAQPCVVLSLFERLDKFQQLLKVAEKTLVQLDEIESHLDLAKMRSALAVFREALAIAKQPEIEEEVA